MGNAAHAHAAVALRNGSYFLRGSVTLSDSMLSV
jgi:hypothetical protein